ncbi:TRI15 [Apiospora rasikravindrae]|uniref:TRI15 n=1 Tax=Apiospora rasikravindrae TaxID=990691 RepID=A0ABR1U8K2_9PEZI
MDTSTADSSNGSPAASLLGDEDYTRPTFAPERCLFCNTQLDDLETNRLHMQTAHGLFIPSRDRLLVDLETLLDYLHLVIFGYNECISCGTKRSSPVAAQQHMLGKNHCRFDIDGQGSEYADFYDFSESGDCSEGDETEDTLDSVSSATRQAVWTDDSSRRLPSGKVISSRSDNTSGLPRQKRSSRAAEASQPSEDPVNPQQPGSTTTLVEGSTSSGSKGLTRNERRENAFTTQLANMRAGDRQALAHLPLPQQRSVIAASLKQLKKARQLERRYQMATERSGNRTLMKHFVADSPARPNG